jgi:hypothetical protein
MRLSHSARRLFLCQRGGRCGRITRAHDNLSLHHARTIGIGVKEKIVSLLNLRKEFAPVGAGRPDSYARARYQSL